MEMKWTIGQLAIMSLFSCFALPFMLSALIFKVLCTGLNELGLWIFCIGVYLAGGRSEDMRKAVIELMARRGK